MQKIKVSSQVEIENIFFGAFSLWRKVSRKGKRVILFYFLGLSLNFWDICTFYLKSWWCAEHSTFYFITRVEIEYLLWFFWYVKMKGGRYNRQWKTYANRKRRGKWDGGRMSFSSSYLFFWPCAPKYTSIVIWLKLK